MKLNNLLKLLCKATLLFSNLQCEAIELNEALTHLYNQNPQFNSIQENFRKEVEAFPQAIARFLPDIKAQLSRQVQDQTYKYPPGLGKTSSNTSSKGITFTQSLFNGGRDMVLLKIAQNTFQASRSSFYENEQNLLFNGIQVYLNYYQSIELYNIASSQVEYARQGLISEEAKLHLGESTITSVAAAQANLAQAEYNKIAAFATMESNKANFQSVFRLEPCSVSLPIFNKNLPCNENELVKVTLLRNFTIEKSKYNLDASKSSVIAAKAGLLPSVLFQATSSLNNNSYPNDVVPVIKRRDKNFSTALTLNIPIFANGGAEYSQIRVQQYNARIAASEYNNILGQVQSNAMSIWEKYNSSKQQVDFSEIAVNAAKLALDGTRAEHDVGTRTILDVLQAQNDYYTALQNRIIAKVQLVAISYQMIQMTGHLTARALKLPVKYFTPEIEFNKIKLKVVGFAN